MDPGDPQYRTTYWMFFTHFIEMCLLPERFLNWIYTVSTPDLSGTMQQKAIFIYFENILSCCIIRIQCRQCKSSHSDTFQLLWMWKKEQKKFSSLLYIRSVCLQRLCMQTEFPMCIRHVPSFNMQKRKWDLRLHINLHFRLFLTQSYHMASEDAERNTRGVWKTLCCFLYMLNLNGVDHHPQPGRSA